MAFDVSQVYALLNLDLDVIIFQWKTLTTRWHKNVTKSNDIRINGSTSPERLRKIITTQAKIIINNAIDSVTPAHKNSTSQQTINDVKHSSILHNSQHITAVA